MGALIERFLGSECQRVEMEYRGWSFSHDSNRSTQAEVRKSKLHCLRADAELLGEGVDGRLFGGPVLELRCELLVDEVGGHKQIGGKAIRVDLLAFGCQT